MCLAAGVNLGLRVYTWSRRLFGGEGYNNSFSNCHSTLHHDAT